MVTGTIYAAEQMSTFHRQEHSAAFITFDSKFFISNHCPSEKIHLVLCVSRRTKAEAHSDPT